MANKKFSEFVLKTDTSDVSHIVGYNGAENVQITPANFVTGGGTGVFLPLAGGTMVGNTIHNDNVKSIYGNPGNDLEIFHDGNNSKITESGSGGLYIGSSVLGIQNSSHSETMAIFTPNSSVELRYDNSKKFETTSTGISVTGGGTFTGDVTLNKLTSATGLEYQVRNTNGASGDHIFKSFNTSILTLDGGSNNATFAGNVTIENAASPTLTIKDTTNDNLFTIYARDSDTIIGNESAYPLRFFTSNSEKMRLDASGNLGLGTSSPSAKIQISGTNANNKIVSYFDGSFVSGFKFSDLNGGIWYDAGADDLYLSAAQANSQMIFEVAGSEKMRIDSSGNVGIGVVPNAPAGNIQLDVGDNGCGMTSRQNNELVLQANANYNTYAQSGKPATRINLTNNGEFHFLNAPAGAAVGDTITFTERMRIDSSGNVGIGSSPISGARLTLGTGALANEILSFAPATGGSAEFRNTSSTGFFKWTNNDGSSEKMRLTSVGDLLIGKSSSNSTIIGSQIESDGQIKTTVNNQSALTLNRQGSDSSIAIFQRQNSQVGSISVTSSATAYNTSSDYRLKEDLQDFEGLDLVSKISVYDFKWKADKSRSYGVMAHQLQEVLPQAVTGDKDAQKMQAVDYSKIVPLLVKSIQELKAEIELLKNK